MPAIVRLASKVLSVAAALLHFGLAVAPAEAEVVIEGTQNTMTVVARESSVAEVLGALRASFDLSYPASSGFDRPVSRTFSGSLDEVIARLLEKYDYVATGSPSGAFDIIWIKPSGDSGIAASSQPSPPPNDPNELEITPEVRLKLRRIGAANRGG